jgi:DNA polymerase-3 subunit delta
MLITSDNLNNKLTTHKVYTLFGEEDLLINQSLDSVYNYLKEQGFSYKIPFDIGANSSFDAIHSEITNSSILSPNKILAIRISSTATKVTTNLNKIVQNLNDSVILVLIFAVDIAWQQRKTKWFIELNNNSLIIEHKKIEENQMFAWVKNQMQYLGLEVNAKVAEIIASNNIYNLPSAYNELQKIKFVYGTKHIDEDLVISQLGQNSKYNIYNLIDNALLGKSLVVNKIYKLKNFEQSYLINLLYNQLKQLINIQLYLKDKVSLDNALAKAKVWKIKESVIKFALSNNPYPKLQKLLLELGRIERSIKGRDYLDADVKLLELLLKLGK